MSAGPDGAQAVRVLGRGALRLAPGAPLPRRPGQLQRLPRLDRMDRLCALSLLAADEALAQAQALSPPALGEPGRPAVAVVFGSAHGCHENDEAYYRDLLRSGTPPAPSPRLFVYTLPSSPAGEISIHFGLRGPALAVVSGRCAGLEALDEGLRLLRHGRARLVCVCAAEVHTPLLAALLGLPPGELLGDGAAALVLASGPEAVTGPRLGPVTSAYRPGDPAAALLAALAALPQGALPQGAPPAQVVADEATLRLLPAGALPAAARAVPASAGSFGALCALAALDLGPGAAPTLLLQSDPRGHGAAALLDP